MAFLMLLHEKMRLQRKQTKLTLKQLRNGNMLSRMESKIKRREKYYAKLDKQIDSQATRYKNQMQMVLNEQYGSNFGGGYGGFAGGLNSIFSCPAMEQMNLGTRPDETLLNYVMQGGGFDYVDKNDKTKGYVGTMDSTITASEEDVKNCKEYVNKFRMAQSQMQGMVQQMKTAYEQQIEDWKTYQKEQLEMQQEYEMDLLAEEQTEYEAEKEGIAAELELVKQRKEAIEQELGQSIKDAAPKFGLA